MWGTCSTRWKRPCGRPGGRWEDNVRMDLREIGWERVDWMHLAQDRSHWWVVVNTVIKLSGSIKGGEFLD